MKGGRGDERLRTLAWVSFLPGRRIWNSQGKFITWIRSSILLRSIYARLLSSHLLGAPWRASRWYYFTFRCGYFHIHQRLNFSVIQRQRVRRFWNYLHQVRLSKPLRINLGLVLRVCIGCWRQVRLRHQFIICFATALISAWWQLTNNFDVWILSRGDQWTIYL